MENLVTNKIDVLALSKIIERDSQSGELCCQLLSQGQTLYGKISQGSEYLSRITPDGVTSIGYWRDGKFVAIYCLAQNPR